MQDDFETLDSLNQDITEEVTSGEPTIDVEKLQETNSKLYARAKEAEAELKRLRSQPKPKAESVSTTNANYVSREELDLAILRTSKGYDDEAIDNLQVISKGKGISLIQAQEDPLFKLMLAQKESDMRKAQSNLGTSKGSTSNQARKIGEMTEEEHRAYVRELANN